MEQPWFVYVPRSITIRELEKKLRRALEQYTKQVVPEHIKMLQECRIWLPNDSSKDSLHQIDS